MADFVCFDSVVVEIKAIKQLTDADIANGYADRDASQHGDANSDSDEEAPVPPPDGDVHPAPTLAEVLADNDIKREIVNVYVLWKDVESRAKESIDLPETTVLKPASDALRAASPLIRQGLETYDNMYLWLTKNDLMPGRVCSAVRSVLSSIARHRQGGLSFIPFWSLFTDAHAVVLARWITAQHLYDDQLRHQWAGRESGHQTLAQITREQAGLAPLEPGEKTQAFMTQAVLSLSDSQAYPAPMVFELTDFKQIQASVFEVARAPGKNVVYLGCALLIIGIFAMLYVRDRRLWVWLAPGSGGAQATMALSANRKTLDTDREFAQLRTQLLGTDETLPHGGKT